MDVINVTLDKNEEFTIQRGYRVTFIVTPFSVLFTQRDANKHYPTGLQYRFSPVLINYYPRLT